MTLRDLDSLVLSCWSNRARSLCQEAVTSLKAGAFRSSIVATWTAVVYDFVEKLQYLADRDDAGARKKLDVLESAIKSANDGNLRKLQDFEATVLEWSRDEFEFISAHEVDELLRLRKDRNKCAHPTLVALDEPYAPSAELARSHLSAAMTAFLMRDPTHGRSFIREVEQTVLSPHFPLDTSEALSVLRTSPLGTAKESLFRNALAVLVKTTLGEDVDEGRKASCAIAALYSWKPDVTEKYLREELNRRVQQADERHLKCVVALAYWLPEVWPLLSEATQVLIKELLENTSSGAGLLMASAVPELAPIAKRNASKIKPKDFRGLVQQGPLDEEHLDLLVESYATSPNFEASNQYFRHALSDVVPELHSRHIQRLLQAYNDNFQVRASYDYPVLVGKIVGVHKEACSELILEFHRRVLEGESPTKGDADLSSTIAKAYPNCVSEWFRWDTETEEVRRETRATEPVSPDARSGSDQVDDEWPAEEDLPF